MAARVASEKVERLLDRRGGKKAAILGKLDEVREGSLQIAAEEDPYEE